VSSEPPHPPAPPLTGGPLDWNLLRSFVAVAGQGSLAGAARALGLAHPTVARHVQLLEAQLGLALFERTGSGLAINEAGQRLAEVAERMGQEARTFEAIAESVQTSGSGRVRVTVAEPLVELMPELLLPLHQQRAAEHREVELVVSAERLNLLERQADIAVRHLRPDQADLICRRVGGIPMAAFASRGYVSRHGMATLADLDSHWFIDGAAAQRFARALERFGYCIPAHRLVFRSDSLPAQMAAAEAGWGVAGLPVHAAERRRELVQVFPDAPPVVLDVWVVARPVARQWPLLRAAFERVCEALEARFGAAPAAADGAASAPPAPGVSTTPAVIG